LELDQVRVQAVGDSGPLLHKLLPIVDQLAQLPRPTGARCGGKARLPSSHARDGESVARVAFARATQSLPFARGQPGGNFHNPLVAARKVDREGTAEAA